MNKNLVLLIKPASGNCNLRCKYCFYHDVLSNREISDYGMMSEDTLESIVKKAYDYVDGIVTFGFQGGEPTLRGLDFYRALIVLVEKYNKSNIETRFMIQTNGILIDKNWAEFLGENKFLVGLSLDGNRDIHDLHRVDANGDGTFKQVMETAKILNKYKVDFNILCVVTKAFARHGAKVYTFLKSAGFRYLQFIPCLDSLDEKPGQSPYSLTPKSYGKFLISLFDCWYKDMTNGNYISIRMFDNILSMLKGYPPESCDMQGSCSKGTILEADGSMYPCDFYVMDKWKLGNINTDSFEQMQNSEKANEFVLSSKNISKDCLNCEFGRICRGGCRRHKEPIDTDKPLENYFCESYKLFYLKTLAYFQRIARSI